MRLHSGKRNKAGKNRFLIFRRLKSNCPTQRHESLWKMKIRAVILFSALRSSLWSVDNVAVKIYTLTEYCLRKKTFFCQNVCDGHKVFRHELKSHEHTHYCTVFMHQNKPFYVRLRSSRKSENDTHKNENHMTGLVKVNISGATLWAEAFARWKRVVPSTFNTPEFDSRFRKVHHQRPRILYHKIWHNKHQKRRISLFFPGL